MSHPVVGNVGRLVLSRTYCLTLLYTCFNTIPETCKLSTELAYEGVKDNASNHLDVTILFKMGIQFL
jgi:hypothetical protein